MDYSLSEDQVKLLIKILRKYFVNAYKLIFHLDQKQADHFKDRNLHYYEKKHENKHQHKHDHQHDQQSGCCGSFFSKVYIPDKERTGMEKILCEHIRPFALRDNMPTMLKYLSQRFNSIKDSGMKDKLTWDQETEIYILNEVLREGMQIHLIKQIKKGMQHEQFIDSKQQLLVATPKTWIDKHPKIELNFLSNPFIEQLMKHNHGCMIPFINNLDYARQLFKELDFLERDGRFEEQMQESSVRQDKTMWVTLSQIEKESFKNIYFIAHVLSSMPYELNAKTQVLAQISESFQFSSFNQIRRHHKLHLDSSIDKNADNGKKISILYFNLENEKSNNIIIVDGQTLQIKQDMMVGLMSRRVPYSIEGDGSKMFVIRYWIDGPMGPCDQ